MAYVHIGGEYTIPERMVIGIFDLDGTSTDRSRGTRDYLARMERLGLVEYVSEDLPRTFVVTFDRVYVTSLSVTALRGRLRMKESRYE